MPCNVAACLPLSTASLCWRSQCDNGHPLPLCVRLYSPLYRGASCADSGQFQESALGQLMSYSFRSMCMISFPLANRLSCWFCCCVCQPAWRHADGSWQPAYANFTSLATPNQLGSGKTALETLLHEGGHAAHFANVDQHSPFFSQVRGAPPVVLRAVLCCVEGCSAQHTTHSLLVALPSNNNNNNVGPNQHKRLSHP